MKISSLIFVVLVLCNAALAQGFANLNFDRSIVTNVVAFGYGFGYGTAKITGWTVYDVFNYVNGDPSSVPFNDIALDAASVNLEGTNYFMPAIQGKYSVYLQGGSIYYDGRNGASIGQTGQIPLTAQSIMYWGSSWNGLNVTFNGQALSFVDVSDNPNYTVWRADISAFAGQTGLLLFTAPWQSAGFLDNIQFSSTPVPEPSELAFGGLGALLLIFRRWRI